MDNFASLGVNETAQLPYNLEAEQSVIGAILLDGPCIVRVMEFLSPECFFRKQHSQIFSIMIRMFTTGQSIDFVTVLDAAIKEKVFESEADAKVYLAQVAQIVPSSANVEAYAKIVREKYYVRSLILAAKGIIEDSQDQGNEAASLLDLAEQRIFDIRKGRDSSGL